MEEDDIAESSERQDNNTNTCPCPAAVKHLIIIICTFPRPPNAMVAMTSGQGAKTSLPPGIALQLHNL